MPVAVNSTGFSLAETSVAMNDGFALRGSRRVWLKQQGCVGCESDYFARFRPSLAIVFYCILDIVGTDHGHEEIGEQNSKRQLIFCFFCWQ